VISVERVEGRAAREEFLRLPWGLHGGQAAWVPPLLAEQRRAIDPVRGDFFRAGNTGAFWLARRAGRAVGRIGAFRNEVHLRANGDGAGFFGFFECDDDADAARALLAAAEAWLRERGLTTVRGPANFDIQEEAGVLLDGFDLQPMVGMTWTPPYYRGLLEAAGYGRCRDLLVFRIRWRDAVPEEWARVRATAERVEARANVQVRPLNPADLAGAARHLARVFADAWRDNWGQVPIGEKQFFELHRRYRLFVRPELVLLAEVDREPAGALVTLPDLNVPIKAIDGRLWPLGWWRLLRSRRHLRRFRAMMMGVRPQFRRLGLPLIMASRCRDELARAGAEELEVSWVLDDNVEMIGGIRRLGGQCVQTLRLMEKRLG
jgi:hypothetical protein